MSLNTAVNTNQKPTRATVIPTNNPDEYRLAFPAHPATRILERQRQNRLAAMAKKKLNMQVNDTPVSAPTAPVERKLVISQSLLDQFHQTDKNPGLRLGQRLYNFFKMWQIQNPADKEWADKLYNANSYLAREMIEAAIDHTQ